MRALDRSARWWRTLSEVADEMLAGDYIFSFAFHLFSAFRGAVKMAMEIAILGAGVHISIYIHLYRERATVEARGFPQ